jgi:hypothetical protein
VLALWKVDLKAINEKAAEALADPEKDLVDEYF